jgi:hypothetical protein
VLSNFGEADRQFRPENVIATMKHAAIDVAAGRRIMKHLTSRKSAEELSLGELGCCAAVARHALDVLLERNFHFLLAVFEARTPDRNGQFRTGTLP